MHIASWFITPALSWFTQSCCYTFNHHIRNLFVIPVCVDSFDGILAWGSSHFTSSHCPSSCLSTADIHMLKASLEYLTFQQDHAVLQVIGRVIILYRPLSLSLTSNIHARLCSRINFNKHVDGWCTCLWLWLSHSNSWHSLQT